MVVHTVSHLKIDVSSTLPLEHIQPRQDTTRQVQQKHVKALSESIAALGLLEPLVVDQNGRLLAGGHRLAAIKLLKHTNSIVYSQHFPDEQIPVRIMQFDAQKDAERALVVEVAENEQRHDYTPAEVQMLAERLRAAGYTERRGRPAQGEKPLRPQLEVIVGKSIRQLYRYLNQDQKKNRTSVRLKNIQLELKHHLLRAKAALEQCDNILKQQKEQAETAQYLIKKLPNFLELLTAAIEELNEQKGCSQTIAEIDCEQE